MHRCMAPMDIMAASDTVRTTATQVDMAPADGTSTLQAVECMRRSLSFPAACRRGAGGQRHITTVLAATSIAVSATRAAWAAEARGKSQQPVLFPHRGAQDGFDIALLSF
mmetsp:Transcript_57076/g.165591  ORF Transcript_57076/g.165591 Transcript_57076/m.165591 type:complete len:110 (+) Transcript_57076:514-843(+)